MLLAQAQVAEPGLRDRLDLSGVVQQTVLEAHQQLAQFRGAGSSTAPAELAGWLRRILANNLADALRTVGRAKRDVSREQSIERDLEKSSMRMGDWLAANQSSPSHKVQREERCLVLAAALAELPQSQKEAVLLRYSQDRPLTEIAQQLGRTPASVVGLLQRGLKALRDRLEAQQTRGEL
jgi:RNA polymerase sigma-70 factor (ECF subfamily)